MALDNDQLLDLIATTLKDLPKQTFEVGWTHQDYEFCRIYQSERIEVDGGTSIQRNVMLDHSGAARYRRLFDTDNPGATSQQHQIDVPWTQISTDYSWDVLEILRQKNSAKGYIRLMKSRRTDGLWSLADKIEDRAWKAPDSATDKLNPYGVPYYINMADAAVTTGGFIGHLIRYAGGTTGTVCAGIDAAVEAKWNNYADVYVKVDNMLLRKLKKAMLLTRFRPPVFIDSPGKDQPGKKRMYVNADAAVELMDLADKRDDASSPKDLAGKALIDVQGTTSFNRIPIVYIPQLDGAAYSPIYTVDFSKFIPVVQEGYWMNEGKPISGGRLQHTTVTVFLDGSHNNLCLNRRTAGFVLHTVTA